MNGSGVFFNFAWYMNGVGSGTPAASPYTKPWQLTPVSKSVQMTGMYKKVSTSLHFSGRGGTKAFSLFFFFLFHSLFFFKKPKLTIFDAVFINLFFY